MKAEDDKARWNMLVSVAEQCYDECVHRFAALRIRQDEASEKLRTLIDYRHAYQEQRQYAEQAGIPAEKLRNHHSFAATLEHATEQQSDRMTAIARLVHECEAEMHELQRKINSYQVMRERSTERERVRTRRVQQGLQDEMASRMRAVG